MATKLTIDEGNSSVKIALWRDDVMVQEVTCRHANLNDMAQVVAAMPTFNGRGLVPPVPPVAQGWRRW